MPVLPVRPGDFALGSPESRAAARAVLERRFAREGFILIGKLFIYSILKIYAAEIHPKVHPSRID
jgi:hypothetical protein